MTAEKAHDKIKKLLALAHGNNNSVHQVEQAILKAQQLMAEYNIDMASFADDEIVEYSLTPCKHRDNTGFRNPLCAVIARNFRCRAILIDKRVHFLGRKGDAEIAREMFEFLYKYIKREGEKQIAYSREHYGHARGVFNSYATGFIISVQEKLDQQCTALMITVPADVDKEFDNMFGTDVKSSKWNQGRLTSSRAFDQGRTDGSMAMNSRMLEGGASV